MKAPQKIADAIQRLSSEQRQGQITSVAAVVALREVIEQDRAYARGVLGCHAQRLLAAWSRAHPAVPDPLQAELFPAIPAAMYVSPGRAEPVVNLTRWGLECARNMLFARTANQVQGATEAARRERAEFMTFYEAVLPHMGGRETTVADALADIAEAA